MSQPVDIQKPRLGWDIAKKEIRGGTPSKQNVPRASSPAISIGRASIGTPDTRTGSKLGSRASSVKQATRKDSVRLFADVAMSGQLQKKMAMQGKLLQMKAQARKDSILKEGGIKTVMTAPSVMQAFRRNISVS